MSGYLERLAMRAGVRRPNKLLVPVLPVPGTAEDELVEDSRAAWQAVARPEPEGPRAPTRPALGDRERAPLPSLERQVVPATAAAAASTADVPRERGPEPESRTAVLVEPQRVGLPRSGRPDEPAAQERGAPERERAETSPDRAAPRRSGEAAVAWASVPRAARAPVQVSVEPAMGAPAAAPAVEQRPVAPSLESAANGSDSGLAPQPSAEAPRSAPATTELLPVPRPSTPAQSTSSDASPRVVIGRLEVEVIPPPPQPVRANAPRVQASQRPRARAAATSSPGLRSKLRYGLGQL